MCNVENVSVKELRDWLRNNEVPFSSRDDKGQLLTLSVEHLVKEIDTTTSKINNLNEYCDMVTANEIFQEFVDRNTVVLKVFADTDSLKETAHDIDLDISCLTLLTYLRFTISS